MLKRPILLSHQVSRSLNWIFNCIVQCRKYLRIKSLLNSLSTSEFWAHEKKLSCFPSLQDYFAIHNPGTMLRVSWKDFHPLCSSSQNPQTGWAMFKESIVLSRTMTTQWLPNRSWKVFAENWREFASTEITSSWQQIQFLLFIMKKSKLQLQKFHLDSRYPFPQSANCR